MFEVTRALGAPDNLFNFHIFERLKTQPNNELWSLFSHCLQCFVGVGMGGVGGLGGWGEEGLEPPRGSAEASSQSR